MRVSTLERHANLPSTMQVCRAEMELSSARVWWVPELCVTPTVRACRGKVPVRVVDNEIDLLNMICGVLTMIL